MKKTIGRLATLLAAVAMSTTVAIGFASNAKADSNDALRRRVDVLEQQLKKMPAILKEMKSLKRALAKTQKKQAQKAARVNPAAGGLGGGYGKITWHLGGFGTADYTQRQTSDTANSFGAEFNPIFLVNYDDLLQFESELEVKTLSDGSTKLEIEFSNLNLLVNDWLTLTAGKFLSPFGDFQQHLHPTWINKLPDRPAGFVEDGGNEPLTEIGVMARGAFPVGSTTVDYAVFVGNGPQLDGDPTAGVKYEANGADNDNHKAFGGRIGFRPLPYVTVGFSGMTSKLSPMAGTGVPVSDGRLYNLGVDAAYTRKYLSIRGEWLHAHLNSMSTAFVDVGPMTMVIPATTWNSWYIQGSYKLAGLTDMPYISNLEPVFRYSMITTHGFSDFAMIDERRWTLGLDYWFTPSIVAKFAYENRNYDVKRNENVLRLQLAFGF